MDIAQEQYNELYKTRLEYWQVKQWMDKYAMRCNGKPVETPHMGALALGYAFTQDTDLAFDIAKGILNGEINAPTPVLNGIRNGDWDGISCSVIEGGDSVESIGVAEHLTYMQTAKKAGVGCRLITRSIGDDVRNGEVTHLGKVPMYATLEKSVKMFTQTTRGGSATVTFSCYDPEVMSLLSLKSQRTPLNRRIDKLDYNMAYDDRFVDAVIENANIELVSRNGKVHTVVKSRDVLRKFLEVRKETARVYCFNLSVANKHTPFTDPIKQSNLCMEIALPTKPYKDMGELYAR